MDDVGQRFEVNEPQFDQEDWKTLRSEDPAGLLRTGPFRSLELESCRPFRELYLELRRKLTFDGSAATLQTILV